MVLAPFRPRYLQKPFPMSLSPPQKNLLLTLAWQSIAHGLKTGKPLNIDIGNYPKEFAEPKATFVRLSHQHRPRGRFGNLHPIRPLAEDVCENAFAAAFCDRQYPSVTDMEISDLHIQIDLLSPLEEVVFDSELDLIGRLRPNVDGLLLEDGPRHAFFMPYDWETLHGSMQFLQQLKRKTGLPAAYWSKTIKASRFTIDSIA